MFSRNFVHVEYSRFIRPFGEIKGLSLDDALRHLNWDQSKITLRVKEALTEFIIKAKESGFDLQKTFIADAYVKNGTGLSKRFVKKYLKGRGRYGSTPHPKTAKIQIIFQQREKEFQKRLEDPLEWIRKRLRDRKRSTTKTANQIYIEKRQSRPLKVIYQ
jgi:hypothetical protein